MKTLYFDCSSGISGNMVLGALTEIIGNEKYLIDELKKLNIGGYRIDITKTEKNGISGTHVDVIIDGGNEYGHQHDHNEDHNHYLYHKENHRHHHHDHKEDHDHHQDQKEDYGQHHHDKKEDHDQHHHDQREDHDQHHHDQREDHHHHQENRKHTHLHSHHHDHRNLEEVNAVIDGSSLNEDIKDLAKRIFLRVAKAESKVHGKPIEEVHFHEVGAVDSIVDIVGTAILIDYIKPDRVISSIVNEGFGFIKCAHGIMSVPVPATSEIFASSDVKFRQIDIDTELVTPTGAAIIAELADAFIPLPTMKIKKVGWGAGTKNLKIPNVLKVYLGEWNKEDEYDKTVFAEDDIVNEEKFIVIETNIDDCNGEIMGYTMDKLFEEGALDVFFTPVFMKKNRPAYHLTVTCDKKHLLKMAGIIFKETTTIGLRYRHEKRIKLLREEIEISTPYGVIKGKKVSLEGETYIYPEYESARHIAEISGIPLKELYKI